MGLNPREKLGDAPHSSPRAWQALTPPLAEWMLEAMTASYKRMTPVQASTIPLFTGNKDVVVEAVTGSGKTLAYVLPVVSKILRLEERTKKHHVAGIIISPTRELATQIHSVVKNLLDFHEPSAAAARPPTDEEENAETEKAPQTYSSSTPVVLPQLLIGGDTTVAQDLSSFLKESPNLLIATPGRLLELLNSPHVHCPQSSFEILVLDEADRLLDLGFKDDLQKILGRLPKQRRTGLFSASISEAVDSIVRVGLRNPVKIQVKVKSANGDLDQRTPSSLQMKYLITPASHKLPALSKILSTLQPIPNKTIIYLSTCAAVEYFQHVLPALLPKENGLTFKLLPLHGKQPPKVRQKTFTTFTDTASPSILLTTDVAARGLDIALVDLVLQVDPPVDPKVFIHRCGRTGRAGRQGLSVTFLRPGHEEDYVRFLEVRKTPITPLNMPSVDITDEDARHATQKLRQIVLGDRALHDKVQKAFVSSVKAYSKHQATSIFRISDLDWEDLGNAWGLLKLPKMPELKQWEGDRSLAVTTLNWDHYAYRDKKREAARRQALLDHHHHQNGLLPTTTASSTADKKKPKKKRAWSDKFDAREEHDVRREKRHKRRDREKWERMSASEREKQMELEGMIEEVRAQQGHREDVSGDFEGFGD